jgi:hypothetical protein
MDPHYCDDGYIEGKKYNESLRNVFDFTITILAVLATAYLYCETIGRSAEVDKDHCSLPATISPLFCSRS